MSLQLFNGHPSSTKVTAESHFVGPGAGTVKNAKSGEGCEKLTFARDAMTAIPLLKATECSRGWWFDRQEFGNSQKEWLIMVRHVD